MEFTGRWWFACGMGCGVRGCQSASRPMGYAQVNLDAYGNSRELCYASRYLYNYLVVNIKVDGLRENSNNEL